MAATTSWAGDGITKTVNAGQYAFGSTRQTPLQIFCLGNAQHCRNAFSIVCKEAKTIQNDKQLHYNETRSLVTIHERMIAN